MNRSTGRRDVLKTLGLGAVATAITGKSVHAAESAAKNRVRGIVFLVSDGMSPGVLTIAEAYQQMHHRKSTAWWKLLDNPSASRGFMDTASANSLVTDSAAASSAWGGGKRVKNGSINVASDGSKMEPIMALLKRKLDCRTGLVTTATTTHATPAGFAAIAASRSSEADIATQYLQRVDVVLGGGSGYYDAKNRADRRDLRADFEKAGYGIVRTREQLIASRSSKLLGTFTSGHLPFTLDSRNHPNIARTVPSLSRMSRVALERFLPGNQPFLLQIEGARIDHAAHLNDIAALVADQLEFDRTLATVLEMTAAQPDVLVIVTSDHGNSNPGIVGMGGGYDQSTACFGRVARMTASHERVFSEWSLGKDKSPAALGALISKQLGFAPNPAEAEVLCDILARKNVVEWNHQLDKPEGLLGQIAGNHTGIGWSGTTHTSDPTIISAIGPQSQRFGGMIRNDSIFGHISELLGAA
ncbi:MAG: alkaline phosphatase [Verrucomicrobiota bacterium]